MEASTLLGWLPWVIGFVGLYLFATPLLTLLTFRHEANPTVDEIDAGDLPLPSEIEGFWSQVRPAFESLGFVPEATLFLPQTMPNVRVVLLLFVNRREKESAIAATILSEVQNRWTVQAQFVEFSTRLTNGVDVNTGNTKVISSFKVPRNTHTTHIPSIDDPALLLKVHRAIVSDRFRSAEKEQQLDTQFQGNATAYIAAGMRHEFDAAAHDGYVRLTPDGQYFRATIKGAYLMTWKQIPPFKQIVERARDRKVKQLLERLGFA